MGQIALHRHKMNRKAKNQPDLFEKPPTGEELARKGIAKAIRGAEEKSPGWGDRAYSVLIRFLANHKEFMIEDVRAYSVGILSEPRSARAWGAIARRAKKDGFIESAGIAIKKSPEARRCAAHVWRRVR